MTTVRTCPVQCLWTVTVLSLWMYEHFSQGASLTSYPHPTLLAHLSSLGSHISANPRGFSVAGSGAVPGAVWGAVGTMLADICPCSQSPMVHAALVWLCLCCLGGMWCHTSRAEQGWAGRKCFSRQSLFLWGCSLQPQRYLPLGLWMTLCLRCHITLGSELPCYPPHLCAGFGFALVPQRPRRSGETGSDCAPYEPSLYRE